MTDLFTRFISRCGALVRSSMPVPALSRPSVVLSIAAGLLAGGEARAAGPGLALSLAQAVEVNADGVYLDQVLATMPPSAVPHLRVTNAPTMGQPMILTRGEVAAWLKVHAPDLASTNWIGGDRVRVGRRTRSLDELELKDLLLDALQAEVVRDRGELELRFYRAWNSITVPDEPLALRIVDLPATGPSANFIVRFELWAGEERLGDYQVSASARIWREIPVAEAPLKRGQPLAGLPIAMERRDILSLRDAPGAFELDDHSLELVENLRPGQPVLARSVRPRPVVLRGQLVDALVADGALAISLKVELLQDGLPGQLVRIRNPRNRRELTGKVIDERTILIPW